MAKIQSKLKVITYNIDGLPEQLDLNTLPWILRPIAWIYKLIKKTTIVKVNDNTDTDKKSKHISKCLLKSDADIIGVQEDFNYHNELMSELKTTYNEGTYMGGFDLSKLFSKVEIFSHFPLPRFKADGLNLLTKNNRIKRFVEHIEKWNDCNGYIDHANDLLTHKGFRYYDLLIDDKFRIDVYVLHMDADFQHTGEDITKDVEARKSQLHQLTNHIIAKYLEGNISPIIIMGDTNSYVDRDFDVKNIQENLIDPINVHDQMNIEEVIPEGKKDCDRIFFINHKNADYQLKVKDCNYDTTFNEEIGNVSDHYPFVVNFNII